MASAKLVVSKKDRPTLEQSSSSGNLVSELKQGVQLKKAPTVEKKPPPKAAGVDMTNLGAMASELAKQRQQRMKAKQNAKPVQRKSMALDTLLAELT